MAQPVTYIAAPDGVYSHHLLISTETDCNPPTNAIFIGGAGTVTITDMDGTAVEYTVAASTGFKIRAATIAPGTATNVIALW